MGSEKVALSAGSPKADRGTPDERYCLLRKLRESNLYAPAVALGVFKGALHLVAEHFDECRTGYGAGARLRDVRGAIAAAENPKQGLLHPVGFERKSEPIAQHHGNAKDRADRIRGVRAS